MKKLRVYIFTRSKMRVKVSKEDKLLQTSVLTMVIVVASLGYYLVLLFRVKSHMRWLEQISTSKF